MSNIIIVGANSGIGYHLVEKLLEQGHHVAVLDIRTDHLIELQESFQDHLLPITADARDAVSILNGVNEAISKFGPPDAAIHNACLCTFQSEPESDYEIYQKVMDTNFFGALRLAKAVLPEMRREKKGRVIFTSSGVGVTGFANISPYASSKGAIEALARCLEIENAAYGISFHLFHPPLTKTPASAGLPIPEQFKADPKKVGYGLAENLWKKSFVICHSTSQALQMKFTYRHPLFIGRKMSEATRRAAEAAKNEE
ncbi:MAG: SDR family NAD(P)-dependent oxidoreductase [Coriobacteriales bacterium]|jgi:NAD(P)-dependent dehydrogenase (short-subunit alcohol dehydrogenase family)